MGGAPTLPQIQAALCASAGGLDMFTFIGLPEMTMFGVEPAVKQIVHDT